MNKYFPALALCFALAGSACSPASYYVANAHRDWEAADLPPDTERTFQAFLIGNAGDGAPNEAVLGLLRRQFAAAGTDAAVVFLGDNLGRGGLPPEDHPARPAAERRLTAQIDAVRGLPGRVFFIPGNRDWGRSDADGLDRIRRQEAFIEAALPDQKNPFLPDDGLPGPIDVELAPHLKLVALDTEWWLRNTKNKPFGESGDYDIEEDGDFLLAIDDLVRRESDTNLLIVGHHPLFSNGKHGGRVPMRLHLFPLTAFWKNAYVPLPIIGSLYPIYLRVFGSRQDLTHWRYRAVRDVLGQSFMGHEAALVYAGAHDQSLQYFAAGEQHHLVSGSGAEAAFVAKGHDAGFTASAPGFMVLHYYRDGQVWLEAWTPGETAEGARHFRLQLHGPNPDFVDPQTPPPAVADNVPDFAGQTRIVTANSTLGVGPIKRFFFGQEHRTAWMTPVELPVFDLGHVEGGLTPVKRGGGLQTTSIRLESKDGREFVLRSFNKDATRTLPPNLLGTAAVDIVQDQVAILHPYAAFIIPKLAAAAGIYHTEPRPYYVPRDPRFGRFTDLVADEVMMLEIRPDDDMSDAPNFGHSKEVISAGKLYREINADNDHRVDGRFFARSRLFDMYLSDWDRHRDQWRWAAFEPHELDPTLTGDARTEGKVYRPIPRDRDWAFNRMDGLFPSLIRRIDIKFQTFTDDYGNLKGLNQNGLEQDRRFTAELSRQDWIDLAEDLRALLTDDVIEAAVADFPEPIYQLDGETFVQRLKVRRDKLPEVAEAWYEILAHTVDVVGSDKHERFVVDRRNEEETEVVVYKTTNDGEVVKELFRRTFFEAETDEIRLYGLGGDDRFELMGTVRDGITIVAVGGTGADTFVDHSKVRGLRKKSRFFDTDTPSTVVEPGPETRLFLSDDPRVNAYDPKTAYKFDVLLPQVYFSANKDDGLFVGGGLLMVRHGFRMEPYASSQRLVANFSTSLQAFNIVYTSRVTDALGPIDAGLNAEVRSPNNIRNFHGLGNQTTDDAGTREFYQARLAQVKVFPTFRRRYLIGLDAFIGPKFEFVDVSQDEGRFLGQVQAGISENTFAQQVYAGAEAGFVFDNRDNPLNPHFGFYWANSADLNVGVSNTSDTFSRLASDLAVYISPSISPQITVAGRVGAAHNIGPFPFFEANTLGGKDNLRGFRSTRFAGRTSFYQNVELRVRLRKFTTYVARGDLGVFGFLDNGRVWTEADDAVRGVSQSFLAGYHQGYGGGLWGTFFDMLGFTATLEKSAEDTLFALRVGFFF